MNALAVGAAVGSDEVFNILLLLSVVVVLVVIVIVVVNFQTATFECLLEIELLLTVVVVIIVVVILSGALRGEAGACQALILTHLELVSKEMKISRYNNMINTDPTILGCKSYYLPDHRWHPRSCSLPWRPHTLPPQCQSCTPCTCG